MALSGCASMSWSISSRSKASDHQVALSGDPNVKIITSSEASAKAMDKSEGVGKSSASILSVVKPEAAHTDKS